MSNNNNEELHEKVSRMHKDIKDKELDTSKKSSSNFGMIMIGLLGILVLLVLSAEQDTSKESNVNKSLSYQEKMDRAAAVRDYGGAGCVRFFSGKYKSVSINTRVTNVWYKNGHWVYEISGKSSVPGADDTTYSFLCIFDGVDQIRKLSAFEYGDWR